MWIGLKRPLVDGGGWVQSVRCCLSNTVNPSLYTTSSTRAEWTRFW
jgi:hypothetical protein